ncbi:hypothetical protein GCM10020256_03670 [Streptomyces thermocoprophilus]
MRFARRTGVAAAAVLALAGAAPAAAQAAERPGAANATATDGNALPPGWRITGEGAGRELEWRSSTEVPMGGRSGGVPQR